MKKNRPGIPIDSKSAAHYKLFRQLFVSTVEQCQNGSRWECMFLHTDIWLSYSSNATTPPPQPLQDSIAMLAALRLQQYRQVTNWRKGNKVSFQNSSCVPLHWLSQHFLSKGTYSFMFLPKDIPSHCGMHMVHGRAVSHPGPQSCHRPGWDLVNNVKDKLKLLHPFNPLRDPTGYQLPEELGWRIECF